MLDLGFVREHLPLIEEKLRLRGMDPGEVLGDFQALDGERRRLITEAETLKAQRNRAAEEIARLKKEKKDAEQLIAQNKEMRTRGEELEKQAAEKEEKLRGLMASIPNLPHSSVPPGKSPADNQEIRRWGTPADVGRAVAAIASGAFPFSTGNVVYVDGGLNVNRL